MKDNLVESFPPFLVEMGILPPGGNVEEGSLVLKDEMPLALTDGRLLFRVSFSLEEIKKGHLENFFLEVKKNMFSFEKAKAYVGPSLSFTSCPLSDEETKEFTKKAFLSVKGSERTKHYLDMKVYAVLALRKVGVKAENVFVSPLTVDEAVGILAPTYRDGKRNVYSISFQAD